MARRPTDQDTWGFEILTQATKMLEEQVARIEHELDENQDPEHVRGRPRTRVLHPGFTPINPHTDSNTYNLMSGTHDRAQSSTPRSYRRPIASSRGVHCGNSDSGSARGRPLRRLIQRDEPRGPSDRKWFVVANDIADARPIAEIESATETRWSVGPEAAGSDSESTNDLDGKYILADEENEEASEWEHHHGQTDDGEPKEAVEADHEYDLSDDDVENDLANTAGIIYANDVEEGSGEDDNELDQEEDSESIDDDEDEEEATDDDNDSDDSDEEDSANSYEPEVSSSEDSRHGTDGEFCPDTPGSTSASSEMSIFSPSGDAGDSSTDVSM